MKVSAGAAAKARGAVASRKAALPSTTRPAAKATAQTAAARKSAPPAKSAKPTVEKTVAKAPVAKPAPPKVSPATEAVAAPQVAQPRAPAAPMHPTSPPAAAAPTSPERRPPVLDRLPPRQPAKPEIFVEGDHVVYPTHGVGKVERIATEEIAGHKLELIHITFEENRMTLRVPVAKARSAGLRKLATRKLFDEALAVLKGRARIKRTMWSRRAQEYEAKINSGDPLAIAEVVRDLHRNAGQPDQSFSERQIYEAAMDRLAAELAALDKTDKLTAASKLSNFLKTV
jgi:CarD family transcriptional regulator